MKLEVLRKLLAVSVILAACSAPVSAFWRGAPTGFRAQVNVGAVGSDNYGQDYPWINVAMQSDTIWTWFGASTFGEQFSFLNSSGYPTGMPDHGAGGSWRNQSRLYATPRGTFTGSISGTSLTVSGSVTGDALYIGATLKGTGVTTDTQITAGSGTSWTVTPSQTAGSTTITHYDPWVLDWVGNATVGVDSFDPGFSSSANVVNANTTEYDIFPTGSDVTITGFISGQNLTVQTASAATLFQGSKLTGGGVYTLQPAGTNITSGSGGAGSYTVDWSQTLGSSGSPVTMTAAAHRTYDTSLFQIHITSITTTPSAVRVYRKSQAALQAAGRITAPQFISYFKNYGRLRFLDWLQTNGSMLAQWNQRSLITDANWTGAKVNTAVYTGETTQSNGNDFTGGAAVSGASTFTGSASSTTLTVSQHLTGVPLYVGQTISGIGISGTPTITAFVSGAGYEGTYTLSSTQTVSAGTALAGSGTQTAWVQGQMLSARVPVGTTIQYKSVSGLSVSSGTVTITTSTAHGFSNGDHVTFPFVDVGTAWNPGALQNDLTEPYATSANAFASYTPDYAITVTGANTFTFTGINTGSWPSYVSGGVVMKSMRFSDGHLPAKRVVAPTTNTFFQSQFNGFAGAGPSIMVYDATLDALLYQGGNRATDNGSGGDGGGAWPFGTPYEVLLQMAVEMNQGANGPAPWLGIPHLSDTNFAQQLARLAKSNYLDLVGSRLPVELSNEVWDSGIGFPQTQYANSIAALKWGPTIVGTDQWYGWKFYNTMAAMQSILGAQWGRVDREFGVWTTDQDTTSASARFQGTGTGVPAFPATLATEIVVAPYLEIDRATQPMASTIYNFKAGVATGNPSLISSAYADLDAALNFPYVNFTGGISGSTMTVTAINSGGTLQANMPIVGFGVTVTGQTTINHQISGTTGGPGTYALTQSSTVAPGSTMISGSWIGIGTLHYLYWPFWFGQATTYGLKVAQYEGGWGIIPSVDNGGANASSQGGNNAPLIYSGGSTYNPLSAQDQQALLANYQNSSNYATQLTAALNDFKAFGGVYPSQFEMASNAPNTGNSFTMQWPSIFANPASFPPKAAFDAFNAN